jgi:hypothetical protein
MRPEALGLIRQTLFKRGFLFDATMTLHDANPPYLFFK